MKSIWGSFFNGYARRLGRSFVIIEIGNTVSIGHCLHGAHRAHPDAVAEADERAVSHYLSRTDVPGPTLPPCAPFLARNGTAHPISSRTARMAPTSCSISEGKS